MTQWNWVDEQEQKNKENSTYFNIVEGDNRFLLLSHFAPLAQVWDGSKYRVAEEGDQNVSVKGVCWVLQDGVIKSAKMPYTAVKAIRALAEEPDWDFKFPFPHLINLNAKGAGTTAVKYTLTVSPKKVDLDITVLGELEKKPSPEEVVEKIKGSKPVTENISAPEYPEEEINPEDIPF